MLPPKWLAFLLAFWACAQVICLTCEGAWLGANEAGVLSQFSEVQQFQSDSAAGKIVGIFNPFFWLALLNVVTFNYAIFYGTWELFRLIVLMPVTVMVIYSLMWGTAKLIRGVL